MTDREKEVVSTLVLLFLISGMLIVSACFTIDLQP